MVAGGIERGGMIPAQFRGMDTRRLECGTRGRARGRRTVIRCAAALLTIALAGACDGHTDDEGEGASGRLATSSGGTPSSASGGTPGSGGSLVAPSSGGQQGSESGGGSSGSAGKASGTGGDVANGARASAGAAGHGPGGGGSDGGGNGGGNGGASAGTPGGGEGGFSDGVGVGEQAMLCGSNALPGGIWCSAEAACATLGCGKPWSLFDQNGCFKTLCNDSSACSLGERCLPPPVAGNFEQTFAPEYESCGVVRGECRCNPHTDGLDAGVCVSETELPRDRECALEGLSCQELERAAATLLAYTTLDFGDDPSAAGPESPLELVLRCQEKVESALVDCS